MTFSAAHAGADESAQASAIDRINMPQRFMFLPANAVRQRVSGDAMSLAVAGGIGKRKPTHRRRRCRRPERFDSGYCNRTWSLRTDLLLVRFGLPVHRLTRHSIFTHVG